MISSRTRGTVALAAALCLCVGCEKGGLKGRSNAAITFYGSTVDQDGRPLPGVRVDYECEAFPAGWTFEKRGEPLVKSVVSATSDGQGRFRFTADAHTLRRLKVEGPGGYRHFYETFEGSVTGRTIPSTYGYLVTSWGGACYKTDADHPAVFVFVKDGATEVSALPCSGGYNSGNGTHWVENAPAWPMKPSLNDVVQRKAAPPR